MVVAGDLRFVAHLGAQIVVLSEDFEGTFAGGWTVADGSVRECFETRAHSPAHFPTFSPAPGQARRAPTLVAAPPRWVHPRLHRLRLRPFVSFVSVCARTVLLLPVAARNQPR